MPYFLDTDDRKLLKKLRLTQVCAECGGELEAFYSLERQLPYLQCKANPQHEGIARVQEYRELNIPSRREKMEKVHGGDKALALRRFDAIATLDRPSATEILKVLFPGAEKASPAEFSKALGLCVDYGLDPRLNDIFLLPFKVKEKDDKGKVTGEKTVYQTVRGIPSTRKIAARKHKWSFLDNTPRYMTEEEEQRVYKTVDPDKVRRIVKLKDMETGAEAPGYAEWPKFRTWVDRSGKEQKSPNNPKGMDKGNTMENMADIRAERKALDRLYPADMPSSRIPVVDAEFVDAEYHEVVNSAYGEEESPETETPTTLSEDLPEGGEKTGEQTGTDKETETAHDKAPPSVQPPKTQSASTVVSPPKGKDEKPKIPRSVPGAPDFPASPDLVTPAHLQDDILTFYKFSHHYWDFQPADIAKELGFLSPMDLAASKPNVWNSWLTIKKAGEERKVGKQ